MISGLEHCNCKASNAQWGWWTRWAKSFFKTKLDQFWRSKLNMWVTGCRVGISCNEASKKRSTFELLVNWFLKQIIFRQIFLLLYELCIAEKIFFRLTDAFLIDFLMFFLTDFFSKYEKLSKFGLKYLPEISWASKKVYYDQQFRKLARNSLNSNSSFSDGLILCFDCGGAWKPYSHSCNTSLTKKQNH